MVILKKQFTVKLILFGLFLSTKGTEINAVIYRNKSTTANNNRKLSRNVSTTTSSVPASKASSINYNLLPKTVYPTDNDEPVKLNPKKPNPIY